LIVWHVHDRQANEADHLFGIALVGYELFHLYGAGISAAVKSNDALKYKWLGDMTTPPT
jgi:hypothetical protein